MHAFTNHLSTETSPYLLQHAHNPVDWYPWGEESLSRAIEGNKPILVSIGYSACHWCHVMERESFEDEAIAAIMNKHFINIKIDREERPDLDHIYMDAVQAITGSGGWPLNVFLTPEGKPFYGGTYFPPRRMHNRPSWKEVLESIADAFEKNKTDVMQQADTLTRHIAGSGPLSGQAPATDSDEVFNPRVTEEIFKNLLHSADRLDGGFGQAPKFPQTFSIQYLLHYHYYTGEAEALAQAALSLDKMIAGGIYDQLGGGFARYSTDGKWLVPHFEKMLYDNALLVIVMSEAYQLTKKQTYHEAIEATMECISRDFLSPQKGFYAALDADSEAEEGKYYVWTKNQVDEILGEETEIFSRFYDVSEKGNWEHKNILHVPVGLEEFAQQLDIATTELHARLAASRAKLLAARQKRIAPRTDDKIILGWNALMNIACSKAYQATGAEPFRELAVANMDFMLKNFQQSGNFRLAHVASSGKARFPAFLDDFAFLIAALISLQEITGEVEYLEKAREFLRYVLEHFSDPEGGLFFYNHRDQGDVIVRKKEIYDGATPSGNSFMALNLLYLSTIYDETNWNGQATKLFVMLKKIIIKYPMSFGVWATGLQAITYVVPELVLTGDKLDDTRRQILSNFIPFRVFQSATAEKSYFPLLKGKPVTKEPQMFLCKGNSCQPPVTEITDLVQSLRNVQKFNL